MYLMYLVKVELYLLLLSKQINYKRHYYFFMFNVNDAIKNN